MSTSKRLRTKPRKKNPQDATLRNIRALKKRVLALERAVESLRQAMAAKLE